MTWLIQNAGLGDGGDIARMDARLYFELGSTQTRFTSFNDWRDFLQKRQDELVALYKSRVTAAGEAAGLSALEIADLAEVSAAEARKWTPVPPEQFDLWRFAKGLGAGVAAGAWGFVQGIWQLVTNPIGALQGISQLIGMIAKGDVKEIARAMFPEIYTLATEWDTLTSYTKGFLAGKVIGQYGAQALSGALATRLLNFMRRRLGRAGAG